MRLPLTISLLFLSILHANDTQSASERIKKGLNDCIEKAQSTKKQITCYETHSDSLDLAMNSTYKEVLAKLDVEQKKKMREAQRTWIQFRDKETAAANSIYSRIQGSIRQQYSADKTYSLIEHRLKELEEIFGVLLNDLGEE